MTFDIKSIISDLSSSLEGSELIQDAAVLTTRPRVATPIPVLNAIWGGGIPVGSIVGIYGPPGSGKSTFAYLVASSFIYQYPNGVVVILDAENSADPDRLKELGIDPDRVVRILPDNIQHGFDTLFDLFGKIEKKQLEIDKSGNTRIPIVVIWDTISQGRAEPGESSSRMDARNRARVIKSRLMDFVPYTDRLDVLFFPLNQVINETDRYGNTKQSAGGGVALSHGEHLRLYTRKETSSYDENLKMMHEERSSIRTDKTKISPMIKDVPMILDVTRGGTIKQVDSLFYYLSDVVKLLETRGGRRYLTPTFEYSKDKPYYNYLTKWYDKGYYYNDWISKFSTDKVLYNIMLMVIIDRVSDTYTLQRRVMKSYYDNLVREVISINPEAYQLKIESSGQYRYYKSLRDDYDVLAVPHDGEVPSPDTYVETDYVDYYTAIKYNEDYAKSTKYFKLLTGEVVMVEPGMNIPQFPDGAQEIDKEEYDAVLESVSIKEAESSTDESADKSEE